MVFDCIVGNPPYQGHWNPLFLQITKSVYDCCTGQDTRIITINPTSVIENKFFGDPHYEKQKSKYSSLKLLDFIYDKTLKNSFPEIEVESDLGIFIYGKKGQHNLFTDYTSIILFGKDYLKKKTIINKLYPKLNLENLYLIPYHDDDKKLNLIKKIPKGFYSLCSLHRGHNGVWDWTTFHTARNLIPKKEIKNNQWNIFIFNTIEDCKEFIKWINTDLVMFVIDFYKHSMKNSKILLERLPEKPKDFSDESLMKHFNLTQDEMKFIHDSMKDYGWKTRTNKLIKSEYVGIDLKCPDVELDGSEKTLLKFLDELCEINFSKK